MSPETTPVLEAAPSPSPEDNLEFWRQRLDRLESEVNDFTNTNQYPDWWNNESTAPIWDLRTQLKDSEADPRNVSQYYTLLSQELSLTSAVSGRENTVHPMQLTIGMLGEDVVARALTTPEGEPLRQGMVKSLENQVFKHSSYVNPELNVLQKAYGSETLTELLGIGGDEYSDKVRSLLHTSAAIGAIERIDNPYNPDNSWEDHAKTTQTWMSKAVEASCGIPAEEARDYVFTASRLVDADNKQLLSVIEAFNHFGIERTRQLTKSTGIHGLEAYTREQLERMEEFVTNPQKMAEELRNHDTSVVLINRVGDHNGILKNTAANFDDTTGSTLFFEISNMADIYRYMSTVHRAGVEPSTLILAAHSAPGQFVVSDVREKSPNRRQDIATIAGRNLVKLFNEGPESVANETGYSMHGMKGMARIVESYMRPSQGANDDESNKGRKKIIFVACHAGEEAEAFDIDQSGTKLETGVESVISQLGKDLIDSGVQTNVDIYGAAAPIQVTATASGIRYTGQPLSMGMPRTELQAERIRIEGGHLIKQKVDEITLRQVA